MTLKKLLWLAPVALIVGCTTPVFTHLTPHQQPRNANNLYPVETTFTTKQQSIRWDSIKAYVMVNGQALPMRPVPMLSNRWEGLIPVPATASSVNYKFKFDYLYNNFGSAPQPNSAFSPAHTLKIVD